MTGILVRPWYDTYYKYDGSHKTLPWHSGVDNGR